MCPGPAAVLAALDRGKATGLGHGPSLMIRDMPAGSVCWKPGGWGREGAESGGAAEPGQGEMFAGWGWREAPDCRGNGFAVEGVKGESAASEMERNYA